MRMNWNKGHRIRASDKHLVYHFSMTGQKKTGTEPYTNTKPGISDKGMATTAETESYQYEVKRCGKNRL